jgi:solute:Na+ symporter, SSS family
MLRSACHGLFDIASMLWFVRATNVRTARDLLKLLLPGYLVASLLIGWAARRRFRGANSYLNATRSLPSGVVVLSYVAANCGAFEVIGLSAVAAQYGVVAFHFYLIGAIPALLFSAFRFLPLYRTLSIRSVPQFLEIRYGPQMRLLNACVVACCLLLLAGVSLFAVAQFLEVVAGWSFLTGAIVTAIVVLAYILSGGLRATIYNEVLQLTVVLLGLVPLGFLSVRYLLITTRTDHISLGHLWAGMPTASVSSPFDVLGLTLGLGFVLGFGYWCTDFVLMQRAFTARTELAAQQIPLWSGLAKLFFALLVVCPGLVAARLFTQLGTTSRYEQALPLLMQSAYGPVMLSVGCTALAASLMSGVAANVAAFASVWTEDIYRTQLRPGRREEHYLIVSRCAIVFAATLAILDSSITFYFSSIMEHVQLIFTIFGTPLWTIFLIGIFSPHITTRGAFAGFFAGTFTSILHLILSVSGILRYGTMMSASFHSAIYAFLVTSLVAVCVSLFVESDCESRAGSTRWAKLQADHRVYGSTWALAIILMVLLLGLNWLLR